MELYLKYLSWPFTVIIIALVLALVFRKPLVTIIQRGGFRIGKEGLSVDAVAAAAAAVSVQSEATPLDNTLSIKTDAETDQRLAAAKRVSVSGVVRQQESRIRADMASLKLSDTSKETVDLLVQHLAVSQLYHAAERLYRLIFGSQIAVLKQMNLSGSMTRVEIHKFYDDTAVKFPLLYDKYSFEAYIAFLRTNNLITLTDDTHYSITVLGKEFMQWMVMEAVTELKPF